MPLCTQLVRKLPPSETNEWVRTVERKQVTENVKGLAEHRGKTSAHVPNYENMAGNLNINF
jgi:hypothetical protein